MRAPAPSNDNFPRWAYVPGRGLYRVLDYLGDGTFRLLGPGDERLLRHRNQFQFRNHKPITGGSK